MTESQSSNEHIYAKALNAVCHGGGNDALPREAVALSSQLIAAGLGPHEIVTIHASTVQQVLSPNETGELAMAQTFLLKSWSPMGWRIAPSLNDC